MDDERLIAAVAANDDAALRELFARHAPWLAARLRRALPADAVEDVMQETFIAVWKGARTYKPEGTPGAWIWGIARRQAALWARTHGRPEAIMEAEAPASGDPTSAAAARRFAALGPQRQHAWLYAHYLALRQGRVPLKALP